MSDETTTQDIPKEIQDKVREAMAKVRERVANVNLNKHYREAIDYLDDNFAFFLTHVLNMGKPEWTGAIPTAAVALPKKNGKIEDFKYLFNPTFAALMEPDELAFVMGHETMHILLNHLLLLKKGEKFGKFTDPRKFNIAADCVINDYLISMGLNPGRLETDGLIMLGEKVVGYNCANATVSEVYLDVPEQPQGEGDGEGELGGYCEGSGAGEGEATGSHDWMRESSDGQAEQAEKIADEAAKNGGTPQDVQDKKQDDDNKGTPGAGPGSQAGALRNFVEQKGVSMKWAELLREVNPDVFKKFGPTPRPSYHKPRRKMMGVIERYPDIGVLPVTREPDADKGETPAIVMYLDGSGSCSAWIDKFVTLAKSVPQSKIKLFPFTFSTYVEPLDITVDNPKMASGGTAFSPIEDSIQNDVIPELGHYPKAVVVLTDAEGYFNGSQPSPEFKDRWLWLLTDNARYAYGDRPGRDISITKFTEGMDGSR
jgi:hypothetical protein